MKKKLIYGSLALLPLSMAPLTAISAKMATENNEQVPVMSDEDFDKCFNLTAEGKLNSANKKELKKYLLEHDGVLNLPNKVKEIGWMLFYQNKDLKSIIIPDGVTTIDDSAFDGCSNLISITIPSSVNIIGSSVFDQTPWLKNQLNTKQLVIVNDILLKADINIESVTIPDNIRVIGSSAFENCSKLNNITLPNSVKIIGDHAFQFCEKLTNIDLSNITDIGAVAFSGTGLIKVQLKNIKEIEPRTFSGCNNLKEVIIPDSVTKIGYEAFNYCFNLKTINIPNKVTTIEHGTFSNCYRLTSITIPDNVTNIGEQAFENSGLTSLVVPDSVVEIGNNAFAHIYVWDNYTLPSKFANENEEHRIGLIMPTLDDMFEVSYDKEHLRITNSKLLLEYLNRNDGVLILPDKIKEKSYTKIPAYFWNSNSPITTKLKSISFPSSVTTIEHNAFYGCSNLTTVSIPNVTSVGMSAFENCSNLTSVEMPKIESIDYEAFRSTGLTSLDLTNTPVTEIKSDAFRNTNIGTNYTLPEKFMTPSEESRIGLDEKKTEKEMKKEQLDNDLEHATFDYPNKNQTYPSDASVNNITSNMDSAKYDLSYSNLRQADESITFIATATLKENAEINQSKEVTISGFKNKTISDYQTILNKVKSLDLIASNLVSQRQAALSLLNPASKKQYQEATKKLTTLFNELEKNNNQAKEIKAYFVAQNFSEAKNVYLASLLNGYQDVNNTKKIIDFLKANDNKITPANASEVGNRLDNMVALLANDNPEAKAKVDKALETNKAFSEYLGLNSDNEVSPAIPDIAPTKTTTQNAPTKAKKTLAAAILSLIASSALFSLLVALNPFKKKGRK